MKRLTMILVAVLGISVIGSVAFHKSHPRTVREADPENAPELRPNPDPTPVEVAGTLRHSEPLRPGEVENTSGSTVEYTAPAETPTLVEKKTESSGKILFKQAVERLVSPQSDFGQREAALNQLRESGKLDQAITDLEQRAANDPQSAECPAALGRLYLQKAGTIQDVREQGILAMKADQVFDAALNLDPANWEARLTKAVAMSYWPTQMNKGVEVMQHLVTLVEQQEAQAPQPQFFQTYLWLGYEYQKYGYTSEAKEIWQRGAALFPDNPELRARLQSR